MGDQGIWGEQPHDADKPVGELDFLPSGPPVSKFLLPCKSGPSVLAAPECDSKTIAPADPTPWELDLGAAREAQSKMNKNIHLILDGSFRFDFTELGTPGGGHTLRQ